VAFRYVAANQHPDHDTVCTFRRRFLDELEGLFVQILEVAVEMGLLEVGDVALDGTKGKARRTRPPTSKHKALSYEYGCKLEEQLTEEVEELMEKAEEADAKRLPEETSVPEEIARREERLKKIREAKQTIEERAQKRYEAEKAAYEEKWKSAGKRKSGPAAKNQVPSRRLRKTPVPSRTIRSTSPTRSRGSCPRARTGSNRPTTRRRLFAWIVTSSLRGISVNGPTTNKSWSRRFRSWTSCPRRSAVRIDWLPTAGTTPRATPRHARTTGSLPTSAPAARSLGQTWKERFSEPEGPPQEEGGLEAMAYRLETREGKDFYGRRKGTAEPIFGIIKEVLGIRQFLLRALRAPLHPRPFRRH
jgi:predicted house-cleaning noncanonical NTP pyrophosphatase (MazG superfamily)